jgi:hypothetical protein
MFRAKGTDRPTAVIPAKGVTSVKWEACTKPISVASLVLVMILALPGVDCSFIPSPAGNTDSQSAPADMPLTISEPEDNTITDVATIEVKGHTSPGAVVSVNAVITIADANGDFDAIVSLDEGPNIIEIVASDETGNQADVTLIVTFVRGG